MAPLTRRDPAGALAKADGVVVSTYQMNRNTGPPSLTGLRCFEDPISKHPFLASYRDAIARLSSRFASACR